MLKFRFMDEGVLDGLSVTEDADGTTLLAMLAGAISRPEVNDDPLLDQLNGVVIDAEEQFAIQVVPTTDGGKTFLADLKAKFRDMDDEAWEDYAQTLAQGVA